MSNLLKQYYVATYHEKARVIDSNDKVSAKIKEYQQKNLNVEEREFVEGLNFDNEMEDSSISIEEASKNSEIIIKEAQIEAETIISDAKSKADGLLEDAFAKSEEIFEEKKNQAISAGREEIEKEKNELINQMQDELETLRNELESEYLKKESKMEEEIVSALVDVFDNIFASDFMNYKKVLLHLVMGTLQNIDTGKNLKIKVSPDNFETFSCDLDMIKESIGNVSEIELIKDMGLSDKDCLLETELGIIDCGIDTEYNSLIQKIKLLSINSGE